MTSALETLVDLLFVDELEGRPPELSSAVIHSPAVRSGDVLSLSLAGRRRSPLSRATRGCRASGAPRGRPLGLARPVLAGAALGWNPPGVRSVLV